MRIVTLNQEEREILNRQDPATESDGGYQRLLVTLQCLLDEATGTLEIQTISKHAFMYI